MKKQTICRLVMQSTEKCDVYASGDYNPMIVQCWCLSWQKNNNAHHRNRALFFVLHSVNGFCGYRCQFTYFIQNNEWNKPHLFDIIPLIYSRFCCHFNHFFGLAFRALWSNLLLWSVKAWINIQIKSIRQVHGIESMTSTFEPLFMTWTSCK